MVTVQYLDAANHQIAAVFPEADRALQQFDMLIVYAGEKQLGGVPAGRVVSWDVKDPKPDDLKTALTTKGFNAEAPK